MGFIDIGSIGSSILSGLKSVGEAALKAVVPAATKLLDNVVQSGFDGLGSVAKGLVSSFPVVGPLASKLLSPLIDKGTNFLSGLTQDGLNSLITKLTGQPTSRPVAGTTQTTTPPTIANRGTPTAVSSSNSAISASASDGSSTPYNLGQPGTQTAFPTEPDINSFGDLSKPENLFKAQTAMQHYNQMITMITNLQEMRHEAAKAVIQNFRA